MKVDPEREKLKLNLKLEKFALNTFYYVGRRIGIPKALQTKWSECERRKHEPFYVEASNIIVVRLDMFRVKLKELEEGVEFLRSNEINFVHYIRENMGKYYPYPRMNIYDKIFMSCAVVIELSKLLYQKANCESCAPQIWSMYFEKELKEEFYAEKELKEEFYAEKELETGPWEKLAKYASSNNTHLIRDWKFNHLKNKNFQTDIELAVTIHNDASKTYNFWGVIETFIKRINRPLRFFCCSECLPLSDALYFLASGEKFVSDFQLVEGYLQIFVRLWNVIDDLDPETKVGLSKLYQGDIFKNKDYENSKKDLGGYNCLLCDDIKKKDVVYLKSIICRTVNEEAIADRKEKMRALRQFLEMDC